MWRITKLITRISFGLIGIFLLHAAIANVLLPPFSYINSIILFLSWEYIYRKNEWSIWLAFGLGFFLELFSSLPFGVTTLVIVVTIIFIRAIFTFIFSDFSGVILFLLGALTPFVADTLTYVAVNIGAIVRGSPLLPFYDLQLIMTKIFINGLVLLAIYGISRLFTKTGTQKLRPLGL